MAAAGLMTAPASRGQGAIHLENYNPGFYSGTNELVSYSLEWSTNTFYVYPGTLTLSNINFYGGLDTNIVGFPSIISWSNSPFASWFSNNSLILPPNVGVNIYAPGPGLTFSNFPGPGGYVGIGGPGGSVIGIVNPGPVLIIGTPSSLSFSPPSNDNFQHAMVIDPATVTASFSFSFFLASVESDEPPHKRAQAAHTLWWKWTPSYSGKVRLKAVRYQTGLPLEVFTGNNLADLHSVADNRNTVSRWGVSGIVPLRVKAGKTYYIRVDQDTRLPVSNIAVGYSVSTLTIEPANAPLPGEVNFSLIAASYWGGNGRSIIIPLARVFKPDGGTPVTGDEYRAQLYAGSTRDDLAPVGDYRPFYGDSSLERDPSLAGLFSPAPVMVPDSVKGQRLFAQIRVWRGGNSFEAARADGSPWGASEVISIVAGSEETGGSSLIGIRSFSLHEGSVSAP